jgi:hypothetical protein
MEVNIPKVGEALVEMSAQLKLDPEEVIERLEKGGLFVELQAVALRNWLARNKKLQAERLFQDCKEYVHDQIYDALTMSDAFNEEDIVAKILSNLRDPSAGEEGRQKIAHYFSQPIEIGV